MERNVNQRIASRVRELRTARGLALESLASKSGVSRSMISLIERGESSPTAVLLEKLAAALGVTLGALFDEDAGGSAKSGGASPIVRRNEQPVWRDPASGYVRRNVSPPGISQPMRIVEVRFPAGGRVAFENGGREEKIYQQIWVLGGTIEVTSGGNVHRLKPGDCLAMVLDQPTVFYNPTKQPARYVVVTASERE
jgi:transcriptional regulator with XRE-family HTH domain